MKNNFLKLNFILQETNKNCKLSTKKLLFEKTLNINKICYYLSFISINNKKYIFFRDDTNTEYSNFEIPDNQITKIFELSKYDELKLTNNIFRFGNASHNLFVFKDKNENILGVGGQAFGYNDYNNIKNNQKYLNFHQNENFLIDSEPFGISNKFNNIKFYNPNIYCPYYYNGLYLFEFDNNFNYKIINNNLPILSGVNEGRFDGHYGYGCFGNLESCKNGLSVFDSISSIYYNEKEDLYYLFQRANLCQNVRHIQYCTSKNLLKWGSFKLFDIINNDFKHFKNNFYHSNFFKIKYLNHPIGILPCNEIYSEEYNNLSNICYQQLYLSIDNQKWIYAGYLEIFKYYKIWIVCGEPFIDNDKFYFYYANHENLSLEIYSLPFNRFCFIEQIDNNSISHIITNKIKFTNNKIFLDLEILNDDYLIKIQLLDQNKNIIDPYTYEKCLIKKNNYEEYETLSEKNYYSNLYYFYWENIDLPNEIIHVSIEFKNINIYSISGEYI